MPLLVFVVILFIFSGFLEMGKCKGNENNKAKSEAMDNNSCSRETLYKIKIKIKNEIIPESDAKVKISDDEPSRNQSAKYLSITSAKEEKYVYTKDEKEQKVKNTSDKGNYCKHCQIYFKFDTAYKRHYRKKHPNEKPFSCNFCHSSFFLRKNIVDHKFRRHPNVAGNRSAHKYTKLRCELCNTEHEGIMAFEEHSLTTHVGVKNFKCPECPSKFFRKYDLRRHQVHKHRDANHRRFWCEFCKNVFQRSDELDYHLFVCQTRQKKEAVTRATEVNASIIRDLEKLYHRTICEKCGLKLSSMMELKEHTRLNHPEIAGIYSCDLCMRTFTYNETLEKHIAKLHPDYDKKDLKKKYLRREKFDCDVCGDEFLGIRQYELHIRTVHPDEYPFRCLTCDHGFKRRCVLMQHVKNMHVSLTAADVMNSRKNQN